MYTFFTLNPQNWGLVASNRPETGNKVYSKSFSPWGLNIIKIGPILTMFMGVQKRIKGGWDPLLLIFCLFCGGT